MKKVLTAVFAFALVSILGESFEDDLSLVENWINTTYRSGSLAHRSASEKLLFIYKSEKTEEKKIADLRKTFPRAFPSVEKENLIVTEPITWEIGSLKLGYDIQEGTATEAKTGDIIKDLNQIEASHGKNKTKTTINLETGGFGAEAEVTAQAGIKGSSAGGTGFNWGIGASGKISGRFEKSSTDRMENGAVWNKKNQQIFQRNREKILSMINQMAFKNLHLSFTVKLYNRTDSDIIFDDVTTASIPVYKGNQSCNNPAKPFRVTSRKIVLRPKNPGGQDIVFRMELDTTSARELVDYMAKDTPRVAFEEGTIKIVNSRGENLLTKRNVLLAKSSPIVMSGPYEKLSWWVCQFHASNAKVTIGEACDAVSQDVKKYKDPLFAKDEKGGLISVSGVPFGKFQVRDNSGEIAFLEYQGIIYSEVSADLLNKPIGHDGFTIHIANIATIDKIQNPKLIKAIIEQYRQLQGNEKFKGFLAYQIALHFKGKQDNQGYFKWIQESADLGNVISCRELGNCFFYGTGIKQNYTEATKWYRKAAEQDDVNAQCKLGECYYDGNGVPQNYAEAVVWYRRAAEKEHAAAQNFLGICFYKGKGVAQDEKEAFEWCQKAANQGNTYAQLNVGLWYYQGSGVSRDYDKAVFWYRKAADQGIADAEYGLGRCYYNGHGVRQDYAEAVSWFQKAADKGIADAEYGLGRCYYYGHGVRQDYDVAVFWYRKAADKDYADAQYALGKCYFDGLVKAPCKILTSKPNKRIKDIKNIKNMDIKDLMDMVDWKTYPYGRRYREALVWYRRAAEHGQKEAIRFLSKVEDKAKDEKIWQNGKSLGDADWMIWVDQKLKRTEPR